MILNLPNLCRKYIDGQNFCNKESPEWLYFYLCWHSALVWHLLTLLPSTLYLLYHLDRVPDQDSGARTWSRLYLSRAKSWSSPDLPYRQLHQKGTDRMCSCCDWKGRTSFVLTQGVSQSGCVGTGYFIYKTYHYTRILTEVSLLCSFSFKYSLHCVY